MNEVKSGNLNMVATNNSVFSLIAVDNVRRDDLTLPLTLHDGTQLLASNPLSDLPKLKCYIGELRYNKILKSNLVILAQEECATSDGPKIEGCSTRVKNFYGMLHLLPGIETNGGIFLTGTTESGVTRVSGQGECPTIQQTKGYKAVSISRDWINRVDSFCEVFNGMVEFERFKRGLGVLHEAQLSDVGQERLHNFVRSLEGVFHPCFGKSVFASRCKSLVRNGESVDDVVKQIYQMRSDTEHLNDAFSTFEETEPKKEDVAFQRVRQIEKLACTAYMRLLSCEELRHHFRTDESIKQFWLLDEKVKRTLWGLEHDILAEPLIENYDTWNRGRPPV